MEFILASSNEHKAKELNELFNPEFISVASAPTKIEVDENGATYFENALLKAEAYFKQFKVPVLADDSGLTVDFDPDLLGVHTARFGGDHIDSAVRNDLLLKRMEGLEDDKRGAHFNCVLCFYISPSEYYFFEGEVQGKIGYKPAGSGGFGYDPIFYPTGAPGNLSMAEVPEWKNENSHRAKAVFYANQFFSNT